MQVLENVVLFGLCSTTNYLDQLLVPGGSQECTWLYSRDHIVSEMEPVSADCRANNLFFSTHPPTPSTLNHLLSLIFPHDIIIFNNIPWHLWIYILLYVPWSYIWFYAGISFMKIANIRNDIMHHCSLSGQTSPTDFFLIFGSTWL